MFKPLPHTNLPKFLWKLWAESYIIQSIISLGIPIIIGQLGTIAQQFADTMMVGNYGTTELAAAGFVNNVFNFVIFFILGFSYASTPVIGAAFGRKDIAGVSRSLIDSIIVNLLAGLFVSACLLALYFNIEVLNQPQEILPAALPYFLVLIVSVPFMSLFNALKQFSDAIGQTKIPMWIMLASNVLNILLNYILIFGALGCPELGLLGAGIATLASRIFSLVALFLVICYNKKYKEFIQINKGLYTEGNNIRAGIRVLFLLGIPISLQLGLEASSFNVTAIFMGWLGAIPLAAHQVMAAISTLCFQVVYGIGAAASVLISQFRGMGDTNNVRRTAYSAFGLSVCIVAIMITLIYLFRNPLIACFTDNAELKVVILSLFIPFFIYQFGDCMQITFANALRGIQQVKMMVLYAFIAYICISIPLAYIFAFPCHLGAVGIWMSFPFGLTTAGLLFFREFRKKTTKS